MVDRRLDPALRARIGSDDILQDAFEIAKAKWPDFSHQQHSASQMVRSPSTYSWLYRITLHALINVWRKHSRGLRDVRREMPLPEGSSIQLGCGLIGEGTSPFQAAHRAELQVMVSRAIGQLKESDREVLWMRHNDQLSYVDIADILEITENAATVRYARAIRRFKDLWNSLFPDSGSMS